MDYAGRNRQIFSDLSQCIFYYVWLDNKTDRIWEQLRPSVRPFVLRMKEIEKELTDFD
jgi:hypothetical protein